MAKKWTHGGWRPGAGRKRMTDRPRVVHRVRPELPEQTAVHVTLRLLPAVGNLRQRVPYRAVRDALALVAHDERCRICQFSIQGSQIHLIVEPDGMAGLTSGMIALKTSCARRLNRVLDRKGRVFEDRYDARYLTSGALVRQAFCFVINNWRLHDEHRAHPEWRTDPFSSADFFDGWDGVRPERASWLEPEDTPPVAEATFAMLTTGWRRYGLIGPSETPGSTSP
jgi:REP element-mobilizing transposase RayT